MLDPVRWNIRQAAARLLPGLLHFDAQPLCVPIGRAVRRLRIFIPEYEILNLAAVKLEGVSAGAIASAEVRMSSAHKSSAEPRLLLSDRPIHTNTEFFPFWEITFPRPVEVAAIQIRNRPGVWGVRARGICVSAQDGNGDVLSFDNVDTGVLLRRVGRFEAMLRDLFAYLDSVPAATSKALSPGLPAVKAAGEALLAAACGVAAGHPPGADLDGLRAGFLDALSPVPGALPPKEAKEAIRLAAPVLDWLLDRAPRKPEQTPTAAELEALAVTFCAHFLQHRKVESRWVKESEALLADTARTRTVEARLNELYKLAGKDHSILPIMFRSHGISGAHLRMNSASYIASMKEIEGIFDALGYETAICYGTFLGAVRDGDFIAHDDDVDMAVVLHGGPGEDIRAELNAIIARLRDQGVKATIMDDYDFIKVWAPKAGRFSDVFPIAAKDAGTVRMYMEQLRIRDVARHLVLPFGRMTFHGESFRVPATEDGFLADRYGADWRTPKRLIGSVFMEV